MKHIKLTRGKFCLVDDEDFDILNNFKWHYTTRGYAARNIKIANGKRTIIPMHRTIINTPDDLYTDHINGDRLDNRKENLRTCTASENACNKNIQSNNTSRYVGVAWDKERKKWLAQIQLNKKSKHLGRFINIRDAIKAYEIASLKYFGKFKRIIGEENETP